MPGIPRMSAKSCYVRTYLLTEDERIVLRAEAALHRLHLLRVERLEEVRVRGRDRVRVRVTLTVR